MASYFAGHVGFNRSCIARYVQPRQHSPGAVVSKFPWAAATGSCERNADDGEAGASVPGYTYVTLPGLIGP